MNFMFLLSEVLTFKKKKKSSLPLQRATDPNKKVLLCSQLVNKAFLFSEVQTFRLRLLLMRGTHLFLLLMRGTHLCPQPEFYYFYPILLNNS